MKVISKQMISDATVPDYRFRPLTEAVIAGLMIFMAITITTVFIHYYAIEALKHEIRDGLARTTAVLAANIDGDLHQTFHSPEQEHTAAYQKAIMPLRKTVQFDSSIAYAYTLVLMGDQVNFILDPTDSGDFDGDGIDDKAHIMQPFKSPTPEMIASLRNQQAITETQPYRDMWGSFISGYAPIYNSAGTCVGVVGLDIKADAYYDRLQPITRATIRALVTGFFIAFLVASSVWFLRNFSKTINSSRLKIYKELTSVDERRYL